MPPLRLLKIFQIRLDFLDVLFELEVADVELSLRLRFNVFRFRDCSRGGRGWLDITNCVVEEVEDLMLIGIISLADLLLFQTFPSRVLLDGRLAFPFVELHVVIKRLALNVHFCRYRLSYSVAS